MEASSFNISGQNHHCTIKLFLFLKAENIITEIAAKEGLLY